MSSSLHVFRGASEFRRMKVRAGTRKVKFAGRSALGIRPGPSTVPQFLGDPRRYCVGGVASLARGQVPPQYWTRTGDY